MKTRKPFLTARWELLLMLNWRISPCLLEPLLPRGTEVDVFDGDCWCSVVAFRFLKTKVVGIPIPFHRDFTEINLRFYVVRKVGDEIRRGVVFVREYVPRFWIALVANLLYNEKYKATHVGYRSVEGGQGTDGEFNWTTNGQKHALLFETVGRWKPLAPGTLECFIAEHYWGYAAQRDGSTVEYQVRHPSWAYTELSGLHMQWEPELCYGKDFASFLSRPPDSAFLANGSDVEVFPGKNIS